MPFLFGEIPEEIQEMMDRRHLEEKATQQEIDRFIEELPIENLITLRTIIHTVAHSETAVGFFDGIIYARLRSENRCVNCGEPDHDHEAMEALLVRDEPQSDEESILTGTGFTAEQHRLMAEYNLDDVRDEDTHELIGFVCMNCGMRYPSIEDRMLKSPDECSGCFRKAAHG